MAFRLVRTSLFPLLALCALLLSGCSATGTPWHASSSPSGIGSAAQSAGAYKIGNPYKVGSVWYYPQENFRLVETGIASWYGPDFHGHRTANGEIYDQNELTAAHRTLQLPSFARVTNLENGRSVIVRVNDRGPYLRGRILDVSKRAADLLGFSGKGTARVRLEVLENESRQVAEVAKRGISTSGMTVADLGRYRQPAPETAAAQPAALTPAGFERGPQVASLQSDAEMLPESLQTPTITVEELGAPGQPAATPKPSWSSAPTRPAPVAAARPVPQQAPMPVQGHMKDGRFMPDPVVVAQPVSPTGLFVQAGSFAVYENASRLTQTLSSIAPAKIEPVTVKGRTLYRVKLGPLSSVDQADAVLAKVVQAGHGGAKVVR